MKPYQPDLGEPMDHLVGRWLATLVVAAALAVPAPALAHGGDAASPSADPHAGHDMAGMTEHDMAEMDGAGAAHDHTTTHDPADTSEHEGHEQAPDTVSPEVRRLVLTGFASANGAVIVAAFLIRRQQPRRARRAVR